MADDSLTRQIESGAKIYKEIKARLDDYSFRSRLGGFISNSDTPGIVMAMVIDVIRQQTPATTQGGSQVSLDALIDGVVGRLKETLETYQQPAAAQSKQAELVIPRIDEEKIIDSLTSRLAAALEPVIKRYSSERADQQATASAGNRVPYVCVRTIFNFSFDDQDEKINGVNKILSIIREQGWNHMPSYFLLGKERPFNGNVETEGLDLDNITGDWANASVFFRGKANKDKYLRVGISLPGDDSDCTKLWLTHQIPSYVSGMHSIETDFEPGARRELADLANILEKQFDDSQEYNDSHIETDERADWFEREEI